MHISWKTIAGISLFAMLLTSIALFHVWNRHQVALMGRKITEEIKRHNYLEEENKDLNRTFSSVNNTQRIELMAKAILKMHMPKAAEVVFLKESEQKYKFLKDDNKVISLSDKQEE